MLGESDLVLLDKLLARSPLAITAWTKNFEISFWSRRAHQMFGYDAAVVLGKTVEAVGFVPPEDLETIQITQEQLGGGNTAHVNVNRNVRADGSVLTCRWTTFAVQDDERFTYLSYTEDITDSVAAQSALVESEERFRSLFEYNPDVIMVFDAKGRVVDVNGAIANFGAAPRESLIGTHYSTFLHPSAAPKHEAFLKRALGGETLQYDARAFNLSGRELSVVITTVPVYRNGKIDAAFSIIRDETDRRAAQAQIESQQLALSDSEARLRSLFENNPDGVISVNPEGIITDLNEAALALGDFAREACIGAPYLQFLPPQEHARATESFARALSGEPSSMALESFRVDGTPLELTSTLIPQYEAGVVVGVYSVVQDVTERNAAQRRAEMQSQRIRNLYFIAAGADYPDVRMRASLEMGARVFDLTIGAVVDMTGPSPRIEAVYRGDVNSDVSNERLIDFARRVTAQPGAPLPGFFENAVALRLEVSDEPYGALIFAQEKGAMRDITPTDTDLLGLISTLIANTIDRSRQRAQLRAMAYYDALTGLPNRLFLSEKVRDAIEVAQSRLDRVAVLFFDLDRFKDVNDTLGHARGDRLLQLVANRLTETLGHTTIARMGGDEFVVLLTDANDVDNAREVAEGIIASLSDPFQLDEYEQFISASVGISMYPEDGRDEQTLIKNADIAMYRAKDRGRNGLYFYNATLEAPIHMRLSQEKLLRRALELNEFVVYYQPQLDLQSGQIVSVEALVRWNHAKSGLIEPSHFIPSAEISGLIVPLGDWVLATAARQVQRWCETIAPLRLAVNLSARQFHQRDLTSRVISAIEAAALEPSMLEVEITETVAMSDAAQTVSIVRDLKASGVRIAVDDFGTGYSSLTYLRRFSLDVLKIDGSFMVGIGHETFDETIIKTVIGMAHSLGLEVVAEGVETNAQRRFLAENACDLIQGYVLSAPLPAPDFEALFRKSRTESVPTG